MARAHPTTPARTRGCVRVGGWPLSIPLGENNGISRRAFANFHAPFRRGWLLTTPFPARREGREEGRVNRMKTKISNLDAEESYPSGQLLPFSPQFAADSTVSRHPFARAPILLPLLVSLSSSPTRHLDAPRCRRGDKTVHSLSTPFLLFLPFLLSFLSSFFSSLLSNEPCNFLVQLLVIIAPVPFSFSSLARVELKEKEGKKGGKERKFGGRKISLDPNSFRRFLHSIDR